MKLFYLLPLFLITSCQSNSAEGESDIPEIQTVSEEVSAETENQSSEQKSGMYIEKYPNGQVKMEGMLNKQNERNGLWISYYENGVKWSESYYEHGLLNGHSVTFFPNGKIRYVGEYINDEKVGEWKFYDEAGELSKTENFD